MATRPPNTTFPLSSTVLDQLDRLGQEFLAGFYGRRVDRHPHDVEALVELGNLLTQLGRLEEGLVVDERLVALAPEDPTVRYNLACSLALLGKTELALSALERAHELGYDDPTHMLADADLASLRSEARFQRLVERLGGEPASP